MIKIEELIHNYIHIFHDFENEIILTNHFQGDWEADILIVDKFGKSTEIEIKFSKSDFKNDFKKKYVHAKSGAQFLKHDKICCGDYACNSFYFLLPMGMIPQKDIPNHCGIIEFYHDEDKWQTSFEVIRPAPQLHNTDYWTLHDKDLFLRKISYHLLMKKWQLKSNVEEFIFKNPWALK